MKTKTSVELINYYYPLLRQAMNDTNFEMIRCIDENDSNGEKISMKTHPNEILDSYIGWIWKEILSLCDENGGSLEAAFHMMNAILESAQQNQDSFLSKKPKKAI